jgi:hypothetical protein
MYYGIIIKAELCLIPKVEKYCDLESNEIQIGLKGPIQFENSSLALSAVNYFLSKISIMNLFDNF